MVLWRREFVEMKFILQLLSCMDIGDRDETWGKAEQDLLSLKNN